MSTLEKETDYATSAIPLNERKSPFTMGLLWITMVTSFPTVMIGFEWFKKGLTLPQVLCCTTFGCLLLLIYSIPAAQLGARSGLSYTGFSRLVFGRFGSHLVAFNVVWFFTCVYGLTALYMAENLIGLFHWTIAVSLLSAIMALVMSANNYLGFKSVANFARYIAAPALIAWVFYIFGKATLQCPSNIFTEVPHQSFLFALTTTANFVIGFAVWGNEMDYWRYSNPKKRTSIIPLTIALIIGQIIFPLSGWMISKVSGITEYNAATVFMNNYSFGGIPLIAAIIIGAQYFASNDSTLYGIVQACENLKTLTHKKWTLIISFLGAACAALLSVLGIAKSLGIFISLNCIILPMPTIIMLAEWFLMSKIFKANHISNLQVPVFAELPNIKKAAVISLIVGMSVGIVTTGIIPGTEKFNIGITSIQSWLIAFLLYIPLRIREYNKEDSALIYSAIIEEATEASLLVK